jgi:MYXO-CTERM domain-containing protein
MTVQTVDQDMFIPVAHDRIESVCMQVSTELNGSDCEPPDVPAPGVLAMLGLAALIAKRSRLNI